MAIDETIESLKEELARKEEDNQKLRKEIDFKNIILDKIQDSVMIHDLDGSWTYVNEAACKARGYTKDEIMQSTLAALDTPENMKQVPDRINQLREKGSILFETQHLRKNGSILELEVHSTLIEHEGKEYVISDGRDISLRKNTEYTLEAIFDTVDSSIILVDESGKISFANKKTSEMFSKELDQIIGENYLHLMHPEIHNIFEDIISSIYINATDSIESDMIFVKGNKEPFWGHISARKYEHSYEKSFVAIIHDITEIFDMEQKLDEIGSNFSRIIQESPDIIVSYDMDGRIYSVNNIAYELLKIDGNVTEKNVLDFVIDKDIERVKGYLKSKLSGKDVPKSYSTTLVSLEGENIPVEVSGITVLISGEQREVAYVKDMRPRIKSEEREKELERELQQSQKMEALGTLTGGIAHDFNNILSAIIGNAELANDDIPEYSPARHNMEEIVEAGKKAADIIKQLLIFSRPSDDKKVPTNVYNVVTEAVNLLRVTIPSTIEIVYDNPETTMIAEANPIQLSQIIVNLSTNAMHAMEDKGGILEYRLSKVEAKEDMKEGEYIRLSVIDSGHGIPHDLIEKIYDPYFTTKETGKGTGLGLAVVKGIIESHGGYIYVNSAEGKGTEFQIYLKSLTGSEIVKKEKIELPRGYESILVVDDDPLLENLTSQQLKSLGYKVASRACGHDALEAFKANPTKYDLVLTDMTMPKMEGHELALKMRKIKPDIPIILHTGYNSKVSPEYAESIECGYLPKPASRKDIAIIVRKELDKKVCETDK